MRVFVGFFAKRECLSKRFWATFDTWTPCRASGIIVEQSSVNVINA